MKRISIVTPCYNEEENVEELYRQVKRVFESLPGYDYEHIFIDNCSRDRTAEILRELAAADGNVKVILNSRNFGHIRSPQHALLQSAGDASIVMAADLQHPPALIPQFLAKWEEGYKVVAAVRKETKASPLLSFLRNAYYDLLGRISETEQIKNFNGYGLYDKRVLDIMRKLDDPNPYFRGLICEIGFRQARVEYTEAARRGGITKNNFYTLYDNAMLGITSHSKVPLRLAVMFGFSLALLNLFIAFVYLVYKLLFWDRFSVGMAPLVIGVFFMFSVVLCFIGILGEYIGLIHAQVLKRPLVIEEERINF